VLACAHTFAHQRKGVFEVCVAETHKRTHINIRLQIVSLDEPGSEGRKENKLHADIESIARAEVF
jgi:hypothetical protein